MYGFCDSGKTISLVTRKTSRVIDKAHIRVYGEERLARKTLKPLKDETGEPDWDAFDAHLSERVATDSKKKDSLMIKHPSFQTRAASALSSTLFRQRF